MRVKSVKTKKFPAEKHRGGGFSAQVLLLFSGSLLLGLKCVGQRNLVNLFHLVRWCGACLKFLTRQTLAFFHILTTSKNYLDHFLTPTNWASGIRLNFDIDVKILLSFDVDRNQCENGFDTPPSLPSMGICPV